MTGWVTGLSCFSSVWLLFWLIWALMFGLGTLGAMLTAEDILAWTQMWIMSFGSEDLEFEGMIAKYSLLQV